MTLYHVRRISARWLGIGNRNWICRKDEKGKTSLIYLRRYTCVMMSRAKCKTLGEYLAAPAPDAADRFYPIIFTFIFSQTIKKRSRKRE